MRRSAWIDDRAFLALAKVAWPRDYDVALFGERNARAAARSKMKRRYEGYRIADHVNGCVVSMESRVHVLLRDLAKARELGVPPTETDDE